jgi:hypothetical protein
MYNAEDARNREIRGTTSGSISSVKSSIRSGGVPIVRTGSDEKHWLESPYDIHPRKWDSFTETKNNYYTGNVVVEDQEISSFVENGHSKNVGYAGATASSATKLAHKVNERERSKTSVRSGAIAAKVTEKERDKYRRQHMGPGAVWESPVKISCATQVNNRVKIPPFSPSGIMSANEAYRQKEERRTMKEKTEASSSVPVVATVDMTFGSMTKLS